MRNCYELNKIPDYIDNLEKNIINILENAKITKDIIDEITKEIYYCKDDCEYEIDNYKYPLDQVMTDFGAEEIANELRYEGYIVIKPINNSQESEIENFLNHQKQKWG